MARNPNPTYPDWMWKVIAALKPTGETIMLDFKTPERAHEERLQVYNFLKWCRRPRNAMAVSHLAGKYNTVVMSVKGSTVHFALRTAQRWQAHDTEFDITRQLEEQGVGDSHLPPPTSNERAYMPTPKGEATPLMPDYGIPILDASAADDFGPNEDDFRRLESIMQQQNLASPAPAKPAELNDADIIFGAEDDRT